MTTSTGYRIITMAVAAGAALTLASCTGDADEAGPTTSTTTALPDESKDAEPTPAVDDALSPLEALWDEAFAVLGAEGDAAAHARVEQLVAECMRAEGWEYTPVPLETAAPAAPDTDLEWGTVEFGEAHGYAIATGSIESLTRDVPGVLPTEYSVDPNFEYMNSLPEPAASEFHEAWWGKMPTDEEIAADPWAHDPEGGCNGKARRAVESSMDDPVTDEKFAGILGEMDQIHAGLAGDPRVVAARAAWSDCVAAAGFADLPDSDAAQGSIHAELDPYLGDGQEVPADVLAELAAKEKALATADFGCRESHDYFQVELEVRNELERKFIETHRVEVEELLAAVAEHRRTALD